jgi:hypothetical protein
MIKASGRVALILFTGLLLAVAGAAQAAPAASTTAKPDSASKSADAVKSSKYRRHYAHRHTSKTADKTAEKSSDDKKDTQTASNNDVPASKAMPPSVANANAQIAAADTPTATAMSDNVQAAANNTAGAPVPNNQVVASDQLNDVDRTLRQDNPPAQQTPAVTATDAQPRPAPVMAASHGDSSAWDQSSLIGKIFIGFGALLTLASAARMFMA